MKKIFLLLLIFPLAIIAQSPVKEHKFGHVVNIDLPDYMSRTMGLNDVAVFQYNSVVKDVYGFIVEDSKEELKIVEMNYSSVNDFYDEFIKDFLTDENKRKVSKAKITHINKNNYAESEASYFDKDSNIEIYYLVGIVETETSFYKVISWCAADSKEKFKSDFQKILYSLKD